MKVSELVKNWNGTASYTGFSSATLADNAGVDLGPDYSIASSAAVTIPTIFGVLFNGVTGIMAGANMSGDLKNASESIPTGTFQVRCRAVTAPNEIRPLQI
jgi:potassium/chloride transporter 9